MHFVTIVDRYEFVAVFVAINNHDVIYGKRMYTINI